MQQAAPAPDKAPKAKSDEQHGQQLGPLLCWAVVFADIGTSIYYVPGILYGTVGKLAGFFVLLTMLVFILLTFKYVEVTYRFPQGGGVVTVAAKAINKWFGALGGMFILVDYFLTAAISCLSGMLYLSIVFPALGPQHLWLGLQVTLWVTIVILILLGILNWVGISESAKVSLVGACIAFVSDIAILVTVFTHLSFFAFIHLFSTMFSGHALTPFALLAGFAGSFLAFSGLESISQLSPVMKLPRRKVGKIGLFLVIITVGLTSPLLTILSTLLLPKEAADPVLSSQLISLLAGHWGGPFLRIEVAISAGALLVFASNTAIIGSYHVFLALSRMEFFPEVILKRNKLRDTPHYSIALATIIPILILVLVKGQINVLGDMYAFGLLGAFTLTCLGMDIVRHQQRKARRNQATPSVTMDNAISPEKVSSEEKTNQPVDPSEDEQANPAERPEAEGRWTRSSFNYYLGILTTVLVVIAWSTNLVTKPLATAFGGSVSLLGMVIAYICHSRFKRKGRVPVITTGVEKNFPGEILAVLEAGSPQNPAIVQAAISNAGQKPVIFLYLGKNSSGRKPELFRMIEPHLNDEQAREDLGKINYQAQEAKIETRFVYRRQEPQAAYQVWQQLQPSDTIVAPDDVSQLQEIQPDQQKEERFPQGQVVHLLKVKNA